MWFEWLIIETQALAWSMTDYDALKKAYTKASKVRNRGQLPPDRLPTADSVVVQGLRAFERGRRVFVHGGLNKLVTWLVRLGPRRLVAHIAGRVMGAA